MDMYEPDDLQRAANLFQAMADPARLGLLIRLSLGEASVGELARATNAAIGTVSARLKVLSAAELVSRRREGQTMIYAIADHHVRYLVTNALEHASGRACEPFEANSVQKERA